MYKYTQYHLKIEIELYLILFIKLQYYDDTI